MKQPTINPPTCCLCGRGIFNPHKLLVIYDNPELVFPVGQVHRHCLNWAVKVIRRKVESQWARETES